MKLYDIFDWCKRGPELENYPYIGEVALNATEADIETLLEIDGETYAIGVLGVRDNDAGVRKIEINAATHACNYEYEMKCPYCGFMDCDSWELQDEGNEHACCRCNAIIGYERVVTVEYNSWPVSPPNTVRTEWTNK